MRLSEKKIAAVLKQHGYKFTPQRWAVIHAIASCTDHLTPTAIYDRVHRKHPNIGLVTIYRTLDILTKLGLICEVHVGGSCHSYLMRRLTGHHHHMVCSDCGKVIDFADCDLSELERRVACETGFEIEDHLLEFVGLCQDCQKE